jgi:hypothetical protein
MWCARIDCSALYPPYQLATNRGDLSVKDLTRFVG